VEIECSTALFLAFVLAAFHVISSTAIVDGIPGSQLINHQSLPLAEPMDIAQSQMCGNHSDSDHQGLRASL
jgi:hypothetical protein